MNTRIHYVLRSYIMKYLLPLFLLIFTPNHALDASYEGAELILLERNSSTLKYKYKLDLTDSLYSIYWNPSTTNYYFTEDGSNLIKTNGLSYKIDPKKAEKISDESLKDPFLSYAGYISPKERLYIDKRDKQQYIKALEPIQDSHVLVPKIEGTGENYQISYRETNDYEIGYTRSYYNKGSIDVYKEWEGL